MTLDELNRLSEPEAREALRACCGASPWVTGMLGARPFASRDEMLAAADQAWAALPRADVAEAIAHHPRLGASGAAAPLSTRASGWSAGEQSGIATSADAVRAALAAGNDEYERRFGHTFILCATGLDASQMLEALRLRLTHDDGTEHDVTARELHRITRLRLEKLLSGD